MTLLNTITLLYFALLFTCLLYLLALLARFTCSLYLLCFAVDLLALFCFAYLLKRLSIMRIKKRIHLI